MMGFGYGGYGGYGACGSTGGGFLMILIPIIIVGIIIYAIFKLKDNHSIKYVKQSDNALDVLNERFVRGEIDEEEYEQKKTLLMKN